MNALKHKHLDPLRYPKVQKVYEDNAKKSFSSVKLFGDIVETLVKIRKDKNAV